MYIFSLLIPILSAIPLYIIYGYPEAQALNRTDFWIQMACTIMVILSLPLLLKFVQPSHFKSYQSYRQMCIVRYIVFLVVILANLAVGFILSIPSCIYLALIAYLALFFCKPVQKE